MGTLFRIPRFVTGLVVAIAATAAAVCLFFANQQEYTSPLGLTADAGRVIGFDSTEMPESEAPAPPSITISTMLDRSSYLDRFLVDQGEDPDEARRWSDLFQSAAHSRVVRRDHPLTIYKDPENGQLRGLKYDVDDSTTIIEASLGNGIVRATRQPIDYIVRPVRLSFEIKDSFTAAAAQNGIPRPIIETLEDAFSDRRLRPGSGIKLIYQEKVSRDGNYTSVGDVEAAQVRTGSRTLNAFAFRDEQGRAHLYDDEGRALGPQSLKFPVNFKYISSGFTFHRFHPILGEYRPHVGVDLVAEYGTPVKAVADGKVTSAGWQGELGRCVRIEHARGMVSIYGHLSKISRDIRTGSYVRMGQVIGNVGSTGLSTGPHLHFALEKSGAYVNPLTQKLGENHAVSPRMQALFEDIKTRYEEALAALPNLESDFITSDARKPAISPLGDMYHVTVKRAAKPHRRHGRSAVMRTEMVTDPSGGL